MTKKKLSKVAVAMKKEAVMGKFYTDLQVNGAKLKKYVKGTPNTGYLQTIILSSATTQQAAESDANRIEIDIPKDLLLKSSKLLTVEAGTGADEGKWMVTKENNVAVTAYEAPAAVTGAGQWIDLVVNTVAGDETAQHICVDLTSFIDVYTNGDGIALNNKVFSIKLQLNGSNANISGLAFDANGALYINIDSSNANGLSITTDGLKLALASASTNGVGGSNGAMSAQDKENLDKVVTDTDTTLVSNAEIASWYGIDITGTPESGTVAAQVKAALEAVSDDSITDED